MSNLGVHTLGDVQLTYAQRMILAKGLRYVPTPPRASLPQQAQELRSSMYRLSRQVVLRQHFGDQPSGPRSAFRIPNPSWMPQDMAPALGYALRTTRARAARVIDEAVTQLAARYPRPNLTRSDAAAMKSMAREQWVIRPADKNLGVTVMSLAWYNTEVQRHMSDSASYARCGSLTPHHITTTVRRALARILKRHGNLAKQLDPKLPSYLRQFLPARTQPKIPRFYLLPKLHKNPPKGRPIVASLAWITTPASKVLDHFLQPLVTHVAKRVLRDTTHMINIMETTHVPPDCTLFTADVVSLYTNIPVEGCVEAIKYWLNKAATTGDIQRVHWWHEALDMDSMTAFLVDLTKLVFNFNYFTTGNADGRATIFRQIVGMAMGTQFAPVGANLYMAWVEDTQFHIPTHLQPNGDLIMWYRFIDDVFGVWRGSQQSLEDFLQGLNSKSDHIKLTHEASNTGINFLDLHIHKGPRFRARHGILDLQVHRKRLNRYLYLPWASAHPVSQKRAFLKGELIRFIRNSSDFEAFLRDLRLFACALRARGYPGKFIRDTFKSVAYVNRPTYLQPDRPKATDPDNVSPFVLVAQHNPLSQAVGGRALLTLTVDTFHEIADEADLDPSMFTTRWITAKTLPKRLGAKINKFWPPSFT